VTDRSDRDLQLHLQESTVLPGDHPQQSRDTASVLLGDWLTRNLFSTPCVKVRHSCNSCTNLQAILTNWTLYRAVVIRCTICFNVVKTSENINELIFAMNMWCAILGWKNWHLLPLWSSGQSSWLHIQRSGFDSWRYQTFCEVVGPEWGPLSLVSTLELLERKSSSSSLENRGYGSRDSSHWPRDTLYLQKLALTSPKSGSRSVCIVHS
jgi:hypothetical protein